MKDMRGEDHGVGPHIESGSISPSMRSNHSNKSGVEGLFCVDLPPGIVLCKDNKKHAASNASAPTPMPTSPPTSTNARCLFTTLGYAGAWISETYYAEDIDECIALCQDEAECAAAVY